MDKFIDIFKYSWKHFFYVDSILRLEYNNQFYIVSDIGFLIGFKGTELVNNPTKLLHLKQK